MIYILIQDIKDEIVGSWLSFIHWFRKLFCRHYRKINSLFVYTERCEILNKNKSLPDYKKHCCWLDCPKRNKDAEGVNKVEYTEEQEQAKKSYIDEHLKEIVDNVDCMGK